MNQKRYLTPEAFKQSLEARLKKQANELGQSIQRVRQRAVNSGGWRTRHRLVLVYREPLQLSKSALCPVLQT